MPKVGTHRTVADVAASYDLMADEDERAAVGLLHAGQFRHAVYQAIQSMEKRMRAAAVRRSGAPAEFCRRMVKGHSLKAALEDLLRVVAPSDLVRRRVENLICRHVLGGIDFAVLHNDLRYPFYLPARRSFARLEVGRADAEAMLARSRALQAFLQDIDRVRSAIC